MPDVGYAKAALPRLARLEETAKCALKEFANPGSYALLSQRPGAAFGSIGLSARLRGVLPER